MLVRSLKKRRSILEAGRKSQQRKPQPQEFEKPGLVQQESTEDIPRSQETNEEEHQYHKIQDGELQDQETPEEPQLEKTREEELHYQEPQEERYQQQYAKEEEFQHEGIQEEELQQQRLEQMELKQQEPRIPQRCPPGFGERYTVQRGDTMFHIARRFDIELNELIAANPHIPDPNRLIIGDVLCVPGEPVVECPPGTERYVVQSGDTMIRIARRFGVTLEALIETNPQIENPNLIFPGDVLCIPVGRPLLPCCIILSIRELDLRGSALFFEVEAIGRFSVGILVQDAPSPHEFGDFNGYIAQVIVPDIDTYVTELFTVMDEPTLLAGRLIFDLPEGNSELPVTTQVFVRPFNWYTGQVGAVILRGSLQECV